MIIMTTALDRAAFFLTYKGKMRRIEGKYPDNLFVIETNRLVAFYEAIGGFVPWRVFCNKRRDIKRQTRKLAGLPERFTGDSESHFTFEDLAKVVQR